MSLCFPDGEPVFAAGLRTWRMVAFARALLRPLRDGFEL